MVVFQDPQKVVLQDPQKPQSEKAIMLKANDDALADQIKKISSGFVDDMVLCVKQCKGDADCIKECQEGIRKRAEASIQAARDVHRILREVITTISTQPRHAGLLVSVQPKPVELPQ
jgi:hypothetical protein